MRHVVRALIELKRSGNKFTDFIKIDAEEDVKGIPPVVKFQIQSDPIGEVGINGCQVTDMLEYTKCLFESLNKSFPCIENGKTISHIKEAINWQNARIANREKRKVEGFNQE